MAGIVRDERGTKFDVNHADKSRKGQDLRSHAVHNHALCEVYDTAELITLHAPCVQ